MPDYFNAIVTSVGGTVIVVSALFGWLGKFFINKILTQETAKFSKALEADKSIYSKELESEKAAHLKEIEGMKNSLLQETESHKIKLKKSEFIFEKQYEAASDLFALVSEINPKLINLEMDSYDAFEVVARDFPKIEKLIETFLLKNSIVLDSNILLLLEASGRLAERGKFELNNPAERYISDNNIDAAKNIIDNIWKAYSMTIKIIKDQVTN